MGAKGSVWRCYIMTAVQNDARGAVAAFYLSIFLSIYPYVCLSLLGCSSFSVAIGLSGDIERQPYLFVGVVVYLAHALARSLVDQGLVDFDAADVRRQRDIEIASRRSAAAQRGMPAPRRSLSQHTTPATSSRPISISMLTRRSSA